MSMQKRRERTETNPMRFESGVTWTLGNQPNTFYKEQRVNSYFVLIKLFSIKIQLKKNL